MLCSLLTSPAVAGGSAADLAPMRDGSQPDAKLWRERAGSLSARPLPAFNAALVLLFWLILTPAWAAQRDVANPSREAGVRQFQFATDTFSYVNELTFDYALNPATGRMIERPREPRPSFTLRCFAVSRTARQMFQHARFEPGEPKASHASYRHLIRRLMARSPRLEARSTNKLVIPGYANLREFSTDYEALLKAESGKAWRSFVQRGNWRMVFPFSRRHQQATAEQLARALDQGRPPVVHLVCFPSLALNHAVLLFDVEETQTGLEFAAYDPNDSEHPVRLVFDRDKRQFHFPPTRYFLGGTVNVYEIYRGICY